MTIATLAKKTNATIKSQISSYGIFTLNGVKGNRKPTWCSKTDMTAHDLKLPEKSTPSSCMYSKRAQCRNTKKDVSCNVINAIPGAISQSEYIRNHTCCNPLLDFTPHDISACCMQNNKGKLSTIVKESYSAKAQSDYITWLAKRKGNHLPINPNDCSLCVVFKR